MSSPWIARPRTKTIFAGAGVLVVCCVVGPVVLAAACVAVDRFLGGWLGIVSGVVLAALAVSWSLRARHRRADRRASGS